MTEIAVLIAALKTESGPSYGDTLAELRTHGEAAVEPLVAVLADPTAKETGDVAITLGKIAVEYPNALPKVLDPLLNLVPRATMATQTSVTEALVLLGETYEDIIPRVIDALIEVVSDPVSIGSFNLHAKLARLGTPVVERLVSLLSSPNPSLQTGAATILGYVAEKHPEVGNRLFEPLFALLKDENPVRIAAVEALGRLGDSRAQDPLYALRDDPDPKMHSTLLTALARLKDDRVVELLIAGTRSDDGVIREASIEALGQFGAVSVKPLLRLINEPDTRVRSMVFRALGDTHDARVVDVMIDLLHGPDRMIYRDAWIAINKVGTPAVPALLAMLNDPTPRMRADAISALARTQDERAAQPIVAMLRDPEREVFVAAGRALKVYADLAIDSIIAMLHDPDPEIRLRVVQLLRDMKDVRAVEPLITMLNDKSELNGKTIAYDAAIALKFIGTPEALVAAADWDIKISGK